MTRHMLQMFLLLLVCVAPSARADDAASGKAGDATVKAEKAQPEKTTSPAAKEEEPSAEKPPTYLLRYKFQPGETLRWDVEHRAQIRTTVSGTTQTVETDSRSTKAWHVEELNSQGNVRFVYSVERVDMRQKLTGRQEERYNSETDKEPPVGFQDAAKSVGVPLTSFTMDMTGRVIDRTEITQRGTAQSAHPTLPLPVEPAPVGHTWSYTYDKLAQANDKTTKKVQLRQQMTLVGVKNGVATIKVDTIILNPVRQAPTIMAQLVQDESDGTVRFDIDAGRLLSLQTDLDKTVVGFQGATSSLHCVTRFGEKLLPAEPQTAAKPSKADLKPTATATGSSATASAKPAAGATPTTTKSAAPVSGPAAPVSGPAAPVSGPAAPVAGPAAPTSRRPVRK